MSHGYGAIQIYYYYYYYYKKETEFREDLYTLRIMAKVREQSQKGRWSCDCFAGNRRPHDH